MSSFDALLRDAESLSHGNVPAAVGPVNATHLTCFFSHVVPHEVSSLKGQLVLAQHGVDARRADFLIKQLKDLTIDDTVTDGTGSDVRWVQYRPLTAIEQLERQKQSEIDSEWRETVRNTIEILGNKAISGTPPGQGDSLFTRDVERDGEVTWRAQTFAKFMVSGDEVAFSSPMIMIDRCIQALEADGGDGDRTFEMRLDFFRCLKHMIGRVLERRGEIVAGAPELIPEMIGGALEYLQEQFRRVHFPAGMDTTMEELSEFVAKHFPLCQPPWPHLWFAMRAGLYDVARMVFKEYGVPRNFQQLFEAFVVGDEMPNQELRNSVMIDTEPHTDVERFKMEAYVFAVGYEMEDWKHSGCCVKTLEDFLFCAFAPWRFETSFIGAGDGETLLKDIHGYVLRGGSAFNTGDIQFIEPMMCALCLRFEECVKSLLRIKMFPVESLHVIMVLKAAGLWDGPALPLLLRDFARILPRTMLSAAVDYLAFAGDRRVLIDFLLLQDVVRTSVNLDMSGKERAIELLRDETDEKPFTITTLQLLILCKDYDNATRLFRDIADSPTSFSAFDLVKAVQLCSVLLSRMSASAVPADIVAVRNAGMRIALLVLSCADELPQSQRGMLVEACRIMLLTAEDGELANDVNRQAVHTMMRVCRILILFDSGMTDQAMDLVSSRPHIIPLTEDDFDCSVEWMNSGVLPSTKSIAAVMLRILSLLSLNQKENAQRIEVIARFAMRIPLPDEATARITEFVRKE